MTAATPEAAAAALETVHAVFFALLGAGIGSFLNVCILRMPLDRSIVLPPSSCPHCGRRLTVVDLIPVLGWAIRLGRCASCKGRISPRYPLVEALTAALFFAAFRAYDSWIDRATAAYLLSFLVVVAFVDLDWRLILNRTTYPTMALGLAVAVLPHFPLYLRGWAGVERAAVGAAVGGGLIWGIGALGTALYRKEAMGWGDVKLLAALGAFVGPLHAVAIVFIGSAIGGVIGVGLLAAGAVERRGYIPFGPFLAAAAAIDVFWWRAIDIFVVGLMPFPVVVT